MSEFMSTVESQNFKIAQNFFSHSKLDPKGKYRVLTKIFKLSKVRINWKFENFEFFHKSSIFMIFPSEKKLMLTTVDICSYQKKNWRKWKKIEINCRKMLELRQRQQ